MILVDSSVWVEHLRRGEKRLEALLLEGEVAMHPFVIGEIGLGHLRNRWEILARLAELPALDAATHDEVLSFVEERGLVAKGIGWVDAHLLAAVAIGGARLWTIDRRLETVAARLGLAAGKVQ